MRLRCRIGWHEARAGFGGGGVLVLCRWCDLVLDFLPGDDVLPDDVADELWPVEDVGRWP